MVFFLSTSDGLLFTCSHFEFDKTIVLTHKQKMATVVEHNSSINTVDNDTIIRPGKRRRLVDSKGYEISQESNQPEDFTINKYGYKKLHPVFVELERTLENGTYYETIKEGGIEWVYRG